MKEEKIEIPEEEEKKEKRVFWIAILELCIFGAISIADIWNVFVKEKMPHEGKSQ